MIASFVPWGPGIRDPVLFGDLVGGPDPHLILPPCLLLSIQSSGTVLSREVHLVPLPATVGVTKLQSWT